MFNLPVEMRQTYLQRRLADIELLKQSLKNNSVIEFNKVGHQILGNCKSFGFDSLASVAARMNSLKSEELHIAGEEIITELSILIEKFKNELTSQK